MADAPKARPWDEQSGIDQQKAQAAQAGVFQPDPMLQEIYYKILGAISPRGSAKSLLQNKDQTSGQ